MIASHDSLTYMQPRRWWMRLLKNWWKCQDKDIYDQYDECVRYFDVRICRRNGRWVPAHGLAEFSTQWESIESISRLFTTQLEGSMFRIVLEKGTAEDKKLFREELYKTWWSCENIHSAAIKDGWEVLGNRSVIPYDEFYLHHWKPWHVIMGLFTSPIRFHAEEHTPELTDRMKEDQTRLYWVDFI